MAEGPATHKMSEAITRTLPFLIRHSAFHTLDHAWEMEDKDLSSE